MQKRLGRDLTRIYHFPTENPHFKHVMGGPVVWGIQVNSLLYITVHTESVAIPYLLQSGIPQADCIKNKMHTLIK